MKNSEKFNTYFLGGVIKRRKCANCGKEIKFIAGQRLEDYSYKFRDDTSTKIFCSWSCLRKYKAEWIRHKKHKTLEDINWLRWAGADVN